ncbi:adenylosuccinate lyase family protein [Streptomyces sp. NPDC001941]|uniref:class-II fumarase/aspartase family protein n=1 Tax=Streptomyces sp. NPDC001941 TaxID=3154659 RepID=UPI00332E6D77
MTHRERCRHERGHITDSVLSGNSYATPASRAIFCDVCRFQRWLDTEAALALAQGELGIIPQDAARAIARHANLESIATSDILREAASSGHTLVGLLRALSAATGSRAGEYVHFGATTQDIQDTAQALEMRDVLDVAQPVLEQILLQLATLAKAEADTVSLGRTHAQPALPITMGLKVAGWADELLRQRERLLQLRQRSLVAQLFGGAGTMAGFGPHAEQLLQSFSDRLGLAAPATNWHTARDRVSEYVCVLAMLCGSLARMAEEIRMLTRPEFGELEEVWQEGLVCSSTMPHKRNPERAERIIVLSRLAAAQVAPALQGMVNEHERDARSWRLEWAFVPDVSHYTLAALDTASHLIADLRVNAERARGNTEDVADQIMSERFMLDLGRRIGKQQAYEIIYNLSQQAQRDGCRLRDLLDKRHDLYSATDLDALGDPATYVGASASLVHGVAARVDSALAQRPPLVRPVQGPVRIQVHQGA